MRVTDLVVSSPEWDRIEAQITGPDEVYTWESSWTFSLLGEDTGAGEYAEEN